MLGIGVRVMVFNATFNNISDISWQSVLLMKKTWIPRENHWPAASHWQTLSHYVVSSTPLHERYSSMLVYHILYIHVKTIKHVGLVQNRYYYHLIEYNLFSPWYSWKNCILFFRQSIQTTELCMSDMCRYSLITLRMGNPFNIQFLSKICISSSYTKLSPIWKTNKI
jgi:hypothetical protein